VAQQEAEEHREKLQKKQHKYGKKYEDPKTARPGQNTFLSFHHALLDRQRLLLIGQRLLLIRERSAEQFQLLFLQVANFL